MKHTENVIEATEADYLYTQTSQLKNCGKGLFTAVDIYKDEVIAIFTGEILTDRQSALRANKGKDKYFIGMLDGTIMDSMHANCFAKYANDANGLTSNSFKNNSSIFIDENDNVSIIATKKIKANTEIFCSYGKEYWQNYTV